MTAYAKVKTPPKSVHVPSQKLERIVLETVEHIAAVVGSTLGPGGSAVLIGRQDFGLRPLVTKDGMPVFQRLGYDNPTSRAIMESARDMAGAVRQAGWIVTADCHDRGT